MYLSVYYVLRYFRVFQETGEGDDEGDDEGNRRRGEEGNGSKVTLLITTLPSFSVSYLHFSSLLFPLPPRVYWALSSRFLFSFLCLHLQENRGGGSDFFLLFSPFESNTTSIFPLSLALEGSNAIKHQHTHTLFPCKHTLTYRQKITRGMP